ncbi:MAG TPA: serine/threonine-protein kinase [Holophagaceae bacterium]|nr:serine/threonine-protein kinase [Holophagaceae bacterium]
MADPTLPATIARYQVKRCLGEGGMGMVFLAEDPILKRRLAIKVVKEVGEARNQGFLRFRREAEISAQLNHPNIVQVYDVGMDPEVGPFLAMEYVEGKSLAQHLKDKDLDPETLVKALIHGARALRAAHRQAIVHRDVKPENILWAEVGRAKLMDFGIARSFGQFGYSAEPAHLGAMDPDSEEVVQTIALRLTQVGEFIGSPAYASPELLLGQEATPASDRYAFAATAFELITGQLPHPGTSVTAIIQHILKRPPHVPADMPQQLGVVFKRAMAFDPDDRPATLVDFLEELIDAMPLPVHSKARLFMLLGQDEDGQTGPVRRLVQEAMVAPEAIPAPGVGLPQAKARPIALDEDPEEDQRWRTGKMPTLKARSREENPNLRLLKWLIWGLVLGVAFTQLFWWGWNRFK